MPSWRGRSDYGDFTADVAVQTAAGPLTVDIRRATLAGITVQGRVRQTAAGRFAGQLNATRAGASAGSSGWRRPGAISRR
jgi:translocation and assembly module TamB